jgi:hypothetical protein
MTIAGLMVGLALLATLIGREIWTVRVAWVTRRNNRFVLFACLLAAAAAILILPRLVALLT